MRILQLPEVDSTNSWLARNIGILEGDCFVYALSQTAGRGQRGNSWEAEPGMNLTASALLHPEGVEPREQFVISEAVALAVVDLLRDLDVVAMVKWPNDIYAGERKICGILIEHAVMPDRIIHSVAGVGININQTLFLSDAPNPVSVRQLTGKGHDIPSVAAMLSDRLEHRIIGMRNDPDAVHLEFLRLLWRGDGEFYPFLDRLRGERIMARIKNVAKNGVLSVETESGECRSFAFKEIEFLL